jgi:hypothetical protein
MEKDKIKQILREGTNKDVTRIAFFDFDGTTMDTLSPETGKPIYKEKTGKDWPFQGWWGRPESLDMNVFDFKPLPEVKSAFSKEASNPNTLMVSLTGRRKELASKVEAILHANGYKFDKYLYNYGSDTLSNKIEQIGQLLTQFPSVRTIAFVDDRDEHVPSFKALFDDLVKNGRLDSYDFTHVYNEQWTK